MSIGLINTYRIITKRVVVCGTWIF